MHANRSVHLGSESRHRCGRDTLDNLRTLCLRCHKIETARLARERADERRARVPLGV
jgi:5-methylcytosine-specific restriction endonuclease McrA